MEDYDFFRDKITGINLSGCFYCLKWILFKVGTVVGHSRMPAFAIRFGLGSMLLNAAGLTKSCVVELQVRLFSFFVIQVLRHQCNLPIRSLLGELTAAGPGVQVPRCVPMA